MQKTFALMQISRFWISNIISSTSVIHYHSKMLKI